MKVENIVYLLEWQNIHGQLEMGNLEFTPMILEIGGIKSVPFLKHLFVKVYLNY